MDQGVEKRLDTAETDIRELTRNVTILTKDVQDVLRSNEEITSLLKEQAVQARDIKETAKLVHLSLQRVDELKSRMNKLETQFAVEQAVKQTRINTIQVIVKYWPIWAAIAAAGLAGGAMLSGLPNKPLTTHAEVQNGWFYS